MQADTLMQAGRWFGFRPGYQDLVRLYIRRDERVDLYDAFEALLMDEESFRDELGRYEGMDEEGRPLVEPRHIPPMVSQHLPWLKPTARNKMWNAVMESRAPANSMLDFFGHPARKLKKEKQRNFDNVAAPLLRATEPELVTLDWDLGERRGTGTYDARVGLISAAEMLTLLDRLIWHPEYLETPGPVVQFIREATESGRIKDWAVVWPQPKTSAGTISMDGVGEVPIIKRARRKEPRIDFVGSDAKHRNGAQRITRGESVPGLEASKTRGVALITVTQDTDGDYSVELADGDLIGLFSLGVPKSATPSRRDLIRWTVRVSSADEDVVVPIIA